MKQFLFIANYIHCNEIDFTTMDKCQHGTKFTHFCIYEYCSAKEAGGCQSCLKKYHSHVGNGEAIRTEDVDHLAERFNVENSVKPKCRQFQEYVFSFFTQVKTQIAQSIDIVCKGMVNKIGYPLLSNLNHLPSYKRIKNKEYKKLAPKELKKFYMDCKSLDTGSVTNRERQLYIEQIVENFATIESLERLMKEYENLAKRLCKSFKHDLSAFKKIQDLKKYMYSVLKIDTKQKDRSLPSDIDSKITASLLQTSPSDQKNLIKNQNSPTQQKEKQSLLSHSRGKHDQTQKQSSKKPTGQRKSSRSQYKHIRNFSIERESKMSDSNVDFEIKLTEHNSYESKEKEILERKQKLMKMMSLKEKSVGKVLDNSTTKSNELALIAPPLLKYQKTHTQTANQKPKKPQQNEHFMPKASSPRRFIQTSFKTETSQKNDLSTKVLTTSSPTHIKLCSSAKSIKDDIPSDQQSNDMKNEEEEEERNKYKFCMVRLPSSESSSDTQNFFKSHLNSRTNSSNKRKHNNDDSISIGQVGKQHKRKDMMSESSPVKISINASKVEDIVTDEEKSAGLYFMALEKINLDECVKYLKAALSYSPRNISAAEKLTSIYLQQNKAKQCLDLCNEYLTMVTKLEKPQLRRHFVTNKSASLNSLGRYSESIMLLESQIIHFEEAKMYKNLGDAYFFVGINQKCQYNYQKAIRINPKLDQAMYNLAVCIFSQGNYFNADVWISKALEIDNKNPEYQTLKKQIVKKLVHVHQENLELSPLK